MRSSILSGSFQQFYETNRPILETSDTINPGKPARPRAAPIMVRGNYEVVVSTDRNRVDRLGKPIKYGSIRQRSSGETMHSVSEPMSESHALYVAQSKLVERAVLTPEDASPLVVWDVGLGAATNTMVGILALEAEKRPLRPVEIVSFENDLDPLKLALQYPTLFPHLRHGAPHELLKTGSWTHPSQPLSWRLVEGDFKSVIAGTDMHYGRPDIIWYDPFSYKVDTPLWSRDLFATLLARSQGGVSTLFTYTASTAVRAALLSAGWFVGAGVPTGPKSETTIARNTAVSALKIGDFKLLSHDWLKRWERSDAQQPFGTAGAEALEAVRRHPQFGVTPD